MKTRLHRFGPGLLLAAFLLASSALTHAVDNPVSIKASIEKDSKSESDYLIHLNVDIDLGWHLYDVATKESAATAAKIEINLPQGVKKIGNVSRPISLPDFTKPGNKIIKINGVFTQKVRLGENFEGGKSTIKLIYQVCNEKFCQPLTQQVASVQVPAAKSVTKKKNDDSIFASPEMLMVGDSPLNKDARQMYPSPAIYDIDNDGKAELVVGDIFGSLNVYENKTQTGSGDPVWSKHKRLNSLDGKPIKVNNW